MQEEEGNNRTECLDKSTSHSHSQEISDLFSKVLTNSFTQKSLYNSHAKEQKMKNLVEVRSLRDVQPIRSACFSPDGDYLAIGANSKMLQVFSLNNILRNSSGRDQEQQLREKLIEAPNYHFGSIYSVDWICKYSFHSFSLISISKSIPS